MNRVFISGIIMDSPMLRVEAGEIPHLILNVEVKHRTASGDMRRESYRVSAWHGVAKWGYENLRRGQLVGMQGYLTQRNAGNNDRRPDVEIAVDEFIRMCNYNNLDKTVKDTKDRAECVNCNE